jgi:hypothetical protein
VKTDVSAIGYGNQERVETLGCYDVAPVAHRPTHPILTTNADIYLDI